MLTDHVIQSNWWALTQSSAEREWKQINNNTHTRDRQKKRPANAKDSSSASILHPCKWCWPTNFSYLFVWLVRQQQKNEMKIKKLFGLHAGIFMHAIGPGCCQSRTACTFTHISGSACRLPSLIRLHRHRMQFFSLTHCNRNARCMLVNFYLNLGAFFRALTFHSHFVCVVCLSAFIPFTVQICVDWPWISFFFFRCVYSFTANNIFI